MASMPRYVHRFCTGSNHNEFTANIFPYIFVYLVHIHYGTFHLGHANGCEINCMQETPVAVKKSKTGVSSRLKNDLGII
jgi:hypothetical protein